MDFIKRYVFVLVFICIGNVFIGGGIKVAAQGYVAAPLVSGLVGVLFFLFAYASAKSSGKKGKTDATEADLPLEDKSKIFRDYSDFPDESKLEALLRVFRMEFAAFFAGGDIREYVTQSFWHISELKRKRLAEKNVRLEFTSKREKYGSENPVKQNRLENTQYIVTDVREDISADRTFYRGETRLGTMQDRSIAHYTVLEARKAADGKINCPCCGAPHTREELFDGCDHCGTKFTVNDLSARVASFGFRRDFHTTYAKYKGDLDAGVGETVNIVALIFAVFLALVFIPNAYYSIGDGELRAADILIQLSGSVLVSIFFALFIGMVVTAVFISYLGPVATLLRLVIPAAVAASEQDGKNPQQRLADDKRQETSVRRFDPLFNIVVFYNNVQNKLARIFFAASEREINAFAKDGVNLSGKLKEFSDILDFDITQADLADYKNEGGMQSVTVRGKVRLIKLAGDKLDKPLKPFILRLEKSADCLTQEIFSPSVNKCKGCGASLSVLEGKNCEYCGTQINLADYDWVIRELVI